MKRWRERVSDCFTKHPLMISIVYFLVYFPVFTLLENFREPQYFIHCALDDVIPFNEWFLIPYFVWFAFVPGMILFFLKNSREDYIRCCKVLYGGMSICLFVYFLFPTGLELREKVEGTNILCQCVNFLRGVDTPTNVCPSIHVSSTVGILLILLKSESFRKYRLLKASMFIVGVLICLSTMFLDQHSVVDVVCGMLLSTALYYIVSVSDEPQMAVILERASRR